MHKVESRVSPVPKWLPTSFVGATIVRTPVLSVEAPYDHINGIGTAEKGASLYWGRPSSVLDSPSCVAYPKVVPDDFCRDFHCENPGGFRRGPI
jgi:hypothetical protein